MHIIALQRQVYVTQILLILKPTGQLCILEFAGEK